MSLNIEFHPFINIRYKIQINDYCIYLLTVLHLFNFNKNW